MASLASINIKFTADLKQFSSQMENVNRSLTRTGKNLQRVGSNLSTAVTLPLVGLGAVALKTAADMETLKTSLDTVFQGNKELSTQAFDDIKEFAATTPFQLEEVATAFIKLKNLGLDPSIDSLTSYGNTASALGKSLDQMIEAVADASVGEFERLKEFGIKAKSEGENVSFTFQGVTTTVRKNSEEIQGYLLNIGNTNFAGSIARQADTFNGKLSTLRDNLNQAFAGIGEILIDYVNPLFESINGLLKRFQDLSPTTKKWIVILGGIAAAAGPLIVVLGSVISNLTIIISLIKSLSVVIAANPVGAIITALTALTSVLVLATSRISPLTDAMGEYNSLSVTASKNIAKEKSELEKYLYIAKDDNLSKKERLKAIKKLNDLSPKYLGNLTLEKINTEEAKKATEKYTDALLKKAKVQAAEDKLVEVQKKLLDLQTGNLDAIKPSVLQTITNGFKSLGNSAIFAVEQGKSLGKNITKEFQELKKLEEILLSFISSTDLLDDEVVKEVTIKPKYDVGDNSGEGDVPEAFDLADLNQLIVDTGGNIDEATANASGESFLSEMSDAMQNDLQEMDTAFQETVDNFERNAQRLAEIGAAVGDSVGGAFSSLSSNLVDSLGLAENGMEGFIKQMIKTVTKLIAIMLSQSISQAISGATASGSATGPAAVFTTPAFIATAVSGVLAAFAAIPKFETGGIVGGNSFYGDRILARVNSGELILNQRQQKRLFQSMSDNTQDVRVFGEWRLSGEDLIASIDRTEKRNLRRS